MGSMFVDWASSLLRSVIDSPLIHSLTFVGAKLEILPAFILLLLHLLYCVRHHLVADGEITHNKRGTTKVVICSKQSQLALL